MFSTFAARSCFSQTLSEEERKHTNCIKLCCSLLRTCYPIAESLNLPPQFHQDLHEVCGSLRFHSLAPSSVNGLQGHFGIQMVPTHCLGLADTKRIQYLSVGAAQKMAEKKSTPMCLSGWRCSSICTDFSSISWRSARRSHRSSSSGVP